MFDPNEKWNECEAYLRQHLPGPVKLIRARALEQSSRAAPWRLDVSTGGAEQSFVLQVDPRGLEFEYRVLKAMEAIDLPTPRAYGLDTSGEALGTACFFSDFIEGESLQGPMVAGEGWAADLYLDTVCAMGSITAGALGTAVEEMDRTTAVEVLETAWEYFAGHPHPLAETTYGKLCTSKPDFPPLRFSNGDLWLDNFLTRDQKLAGIIDFAQAGFSDPVFEFLLSFFVEPALKGRGIEARYCRRIGVDPGVIHWYHGLELFDTWRWTLSTGEPFVDHTTESLEADLREWLAS